MKPSDADRFTWLPRWAKRLVQAFLAVLSLTGMAMAPSAEQFFSGRYLELARVLQAKDFAKARELAQGLDLEAPGRKDMTLLWFAIANKNFPAVRPLCGQAWCVQNPAQVRTAPATPPTVPPFSMSAMTPGARPSLPELQALLFPQGAASPSLWAVLDGARSPLVHRTLLTSRLEVRTLFDLSEATA